MGWETVETAKTLVMLCLLNDSTDYLRVQLRLSRSEKGKVSASATDTDSIPLHTWKMLGHKVNFEKFRYEERNQQNTRRVDVELPV